ncbi:YcaO-like family protein, partial [Patescibacteria group bacterium]|nr:YcaO-like family protein [Patescibacteria group bacterium]
MENLAIPLLQASCSVSNQKTTFTTTEKEVIVHAPVSLIKQVIKLCDGTQTFEKVIETLSMAWDKESVEGFLEGLFSENIIVDGRKLEKNFWKAVSNPMLYPTIISPEMVSSLVSQAVERHRADDFDICFQHSNNQLGNLFARRRSVRSFSGEQVSFQSIVDLLWSAYGECSSKDGLSHRTIPSAGALYPLMFHICLFEKTDQLDAGVYRVCYGQDETVGFNHVSDDTLAFTRAFLNPADIQEGVHGVIVISGSFDISNQKYGNRSLLYVPLEAGHSAQNILLEATRQNVATLEIGGFVDKLLSDSIHLPTSYHPLTLVAFGKEQKKKTQKETPPSIEVDWAIPMANGYNPGFAIVSARLSPKRGWSHGRDPSPEMALKKAISETKEWTACGCVPELVQATYGDLDNVIDPQEVIRFYHYQYKTRNFPFEKFSDSIEYGWIKGVDVEGNQYHVLADHVYFPYFPDTPYYCYANSSGCAAHPDKKIALETATLELVERDSFMIAYLCQLDMPLVCH